MLPERSTLLVPEFPRSLRLRIKALANLRDQTMHEVIEDLLEDALTEYRQAISMAEVHSGILTATLGAFASIISNNLNIVMKFLAAVTIIIAFPTMIASLFGMNVNLPFQNHPWAFIGIL